MLYFTGTTSALWSRSKSLPTNYLIKAIYGDSLVWAFYATLGATFGTSLGCRSMSSTSTYEASFHRVYDEACR